MDGSNLKAKNLAGNLPLYLVQQSEPAFFRAAVCLLTAQQIDGGIHQPDIEAIVTFLFLERDLARLHPVKTICELESSGQSLDLRCILRLAKFGSELTDTPEYRNGVPILIIIRAIHHKIHELSGKKYNPRQTMDMNTVLKLATTAHQAPESLLSGFAGWFSRRTGPAADTSTTPTAHPRPLQWHYR